MICCEDIKVINDIKEQLHKKFKMKDLNKVRSYIGIDIENDYGNCRNSLTLSQKNYKESLAKLYNIENSKLLNTLM